MKSVDEIWDSVLKYIQENTTNVSYTTWFEPIQINSIDNTIKIAYLSIEQDFVISVLQSRYLSLLEASFKSILKEDYKVVIKKPEEYAKSRKNNATSYEGNSPSKSNSDTFANQKENSQIEDFEPTLDKQRIFNPRYNFDNFIVGESNRYAHAAARAVAETPGVRNPLFLHGNSGLGKTHLMHAIGIHLLQNNNNLNVLYVSSEMFTNEFIKSLSENKTREFKNKYRKLDVLLIDDIQFLEKKIAMQEEFFHTFNALYDLNKQIIISSDRHPNYLESFDERLKGRFNWNLIADLQPADYEMRVAILLKKAENKNLTVTDNIYSVICLIAEKIVDSIRELEGAFNRVIDFSSLLNEEINENFAKRILKDSIPSGIVSVKPEKIKNIVCKHYSIKISDIESQRKTNNISYPRQVAMFLCKEMTDFSNQKIGSLFGDRHYSTVIYAHEKISNDIAINEDLAALIQAMKKEISDFNI